MLPLRWLQGAEAWPGPGCVEIWGSVLKYGSWTSLRCSRLYPWVNLPRSSIEEDWAGVKVAIAVPTHARLHRPQALVGCWSVWRKDTVLLLLVRECAVARSVTAARRHSFEEPPWKAAFSKDVVWRSRHKGRRMPYTAPVVQPQLLERTESALYSSGSSTTTSGKDGECLTALVVQPASGKDRVVAPWFIMVCGWMWLLGPSCWFVALWAILLLRWLFGPSWTF